LLRVQMAPVLSAAEGEAEAVSGFVLMLDNITRNFEAETRRDQMLIPSPRAAARPWPTCAPRPRCWSIPISIRS
jgi:hypothetical protein